MNIETAKAPENPHQTTEHTQRAMELDINSYWVTFNFYFPDGPTPGAIRGEKLMAAMTRPATRYLTPDSRDFFYLTAAG